MKRLVHGLLTLLVVSWIARHGGEMGDLFVFIFGPMMVLGAFQGCFED